MPVSAALTIKESRISFTFRRNTFSIFLRLADGAEELYYRQHIIILLLNETCERNSRMPINTNFVLRQFIYALASSAPHRHNRLRAKCHRRHFSMKAAAVLTTREMSRVAIAAADHWPRL